MHNYFPYWILAKSSFSDAVFAPNFLKISILTDRRKCTVGTAHFASYVHIYFIFKLHQKTTPVKSSEVKISHALSKVPTKLLRSVILALLLEAVISYTLINFFP